MWSTTAHCISITHESCQRRRYENSKNCSIYDSSQTHIWISNRTLSAGNPCNGKPWVETLGKYLFFYFCTHAARRASRGVWCDSFIYLIIHSILFRLSRKKFLLFHNTYLAKTNMIRWCGTCGNICFCSGCARSVTHYFASICISCDCFGSQRPLKPSLCTHRISTVVAGRVSHGNVRLRWHSYQLCGSFVHISICSLR